MTPRPHLAALLGLALCGGCGEPAPERPHVVLVLVDQLRKDWAEEWMPETLALAERGVIFEDMRSAAPWTYPSVVSMFSGLYPQQHGADGAPTNGKELSTFDARVPMLPLLLKDHYHTAGFVTNPFLQDWNPIHLGFDHYAIDEFIGDQGATRGNPELVWTRDMFADDVNASVLAHYAERGAPSEPEFTYVHYIDVHGPWEGAPFEHGQALERDTAPAVREAATRYVDARIAELHRFFDERYGGNLVFLVTSDHGMEMPGDLTREAPLRAADGQPFPLRQRKATVHDFNTRIPFLVLPGRDVPNAGRIAGACSNVDIHATVLDGKGRRMSKSAKNGIDPLDLIEQYGADAMRYSLILLTFGTMTFFFYGAYAVIATFIAENYPPDLRATAASFSGSLAIELGLGGGPLVADHLSTSSRVWPATYSMLMKYVSSCTPSS